MALSVLFFALDGINEKTIYLTLKGNHYSSDPLELDSFFGQSVIKQESHVHTGTMWKDT